MNIYLSALRRSWHLAAAGLLASGMLIPNAHAANITVVVKNAPKKCAPLVVSIFNSKETFLERPAYQGTAEFAKGASLEFKDLPNGEYAVSAYCDNNQNGEIDRGAFGRPTEPSGMSRGARGRNGPPLFEDAVVKLRAKDIVVPLKIR